MPTLVQLRLLATSAPPMMNAAFREQITAYEIRAKK